METTKKWGALIGREVQITDAASPFDRQRGEIINYSRGEYAIQLYGDTDVIWAMREQFYVF